MTQTHRFFRAPDAVYESLRAQVDAAWGYPTPYTQTCVPTAAEQWHDAGGWCVIALSLTWLSWEPAASLIPDAVAAGLIEEIAAEEFWAAAPQPEV